MSERFLASVLPRHETAELYRLMVTGIRDVAVCLMDQHGIVTVWNKAAELIKGYCADDVLGRHISLQYGEQDRASGKPERILREAARLGTCADESWRPRKDGTPYWAHSVTTALRDEEGRLLGFSDVTTDLSRHKRLEQCEKERHEIDLVLRAAGSGTWTWNVDTNTLELSSHLLGIIGFPPDTPRRSLQDWLDHVHPDDRAHVEPLLDNVLSGRAPGPIDYEVRARCRDGSYRWLLTRGNWGPSQPGEPRQFVGVCVDIDRFKRAEQDKDALNALLEHERARFASILDQLPTGILLADMPGGRLSYRNQAAEALMAVDLGTVRGFDDYGCFRFIDARGRHMQLDECPLVRVMREGPTGSASEEIIYARPDGARLHFAVTTARIQDQDGVARTAVAVIQDITELKQARQLAAREKERALVTLAAITEGVITLDRNGHVTGMNPAAEQLSNLSWEHANGRALCDLMAFDDEASRLNLRSAIHTCACERQVSTTQPALTLRAPDGSLRWLEHALAPVALADDLPGVVLVLHDVTESKRLMRRLGFEASHDALTGLVNRREFETRLQRAIERAHQNREACAALLYLDLDQFKIVNDTCGHPAGDELLRQLAQLYGAHVRERDTLARIGGDEFALIVEHCDVDHAVAVAHKILDATRAFRYVCNERPFQLGISIGLTPIDGRTAGVEEAMRRADHACYMAKERGRNRIYVHHHGDVELAQRRSDMYWVTRISQALQFEQLRLYCQPIVAIGDGAPARHVEILLRLHDGSGHPVLPGTFLPAAERYDLIVKVDRWVLSNTLAWMAAHPEETAHLDACSINLSRRALADPSFHQFAANLIDESTVPANKLCFEITEHGAIADMRSTIAFIEALSARGCRFSLDDFGTGMTSFSYLKQLPVDYIKIDGSFIQTMASSQVDFEMVRFTNDISHMMGRKTIAEYVSDAAILERLRGIGVDYAQGYWVGKPRPLAA